MNTNVSLAGTPEAGGTSSYREAKRILRESSGLNPWSYIVHTACDSGADLVEVADYGEWSSNGSVDGQVAFRVRRVAHNVLHVSSFGTQLLLAARFQSEFWNTYFSLFKSKITTASEYHTFKRQETGTQSNRGHQPEVGQTPLHYDTQRVCGESGSGRVFCQDA